uniref:BTB domain-containing protein n=1 Tax=Caenorhabditis japonica TaxID=281687 RepID=A0A8R1IGR2_CAEJA
MASPVFLQRFIGSEKQEIEVPEVKNARDFQRILNLIYPPHLAPKQWIKQTHCKDQQLADIRRILDIAKLLKISIILEKTDEFVLKFGNLELGAAILLAQNYGLRKLMGSKIASIQTIRQISTLAEFSSFSKKTKGLILDHILSRATKTI